jgi:hypothetical protein
MLRQCSELITVDTYARSELRPRPRESVDMLALIDGPGFLPGTEAGVCVGGLFRIQCPAQRRVQLRELQNVPLSRKAEMPLEVGTIAHCRILVEPFGLLWDRRHLDVLETCL